MNSQLFRNYRVFVYVLVAVLTVILMGVFINNYLNQSRAAQPKVNVTISPSSGSFTVNTEQTVSVVLDPAAGKKISGFRLAFETEGSLDITGFGPAESFPDGSTASFTKLIETNKRVAYVIKMKDGKSLPKAVKVPVKIKLTSAANGKLKLIVKKGKSQVVGPVSSVEYEFGTVDVGSYTGTNTGGSSSSSSNQSSSVSSQTSSQSSSNASSSSTSSQSSSTSSGSSSSSSSAGNSSSSVSSSSSSVNANCLCSNDACSSDCSFNKYSNVTYTNPLKCVVTADIFKSSPDAAKKTNWCRRDMRTKGDADGIGGVTDIDYDYYIQVVRGAKIDPSVNPDFNGDGEVGASDRAIIIRTLTGS